LKRLLEGDMAAGVQYVKIKGKADFADAFSDFFPRLDEQEAFPCSV
jgi:hypothetical protein